MFNGTGLDASGIGRVSGMCVAGRLFGVMFAVEAFIKLAYAFGLCEGKLSGVMYLGQEVCMVHGEQGCGVFG